VARCRTTVNGRRGLPEEIKHLQDVRFFELWAATRTAESRNRVAEGRTEQWIYNRGYERCSRGICQLLQIEIQRRRCLRCQRNEEEEERRGEERGGTPCTVTAPAGVAGHRLPVWATKIGGDSLCLCTLKEDCEQSAKWATVWKYTWNTVAEWAGQGKTPGSAARCAPWPGGLEGRRGGGFARGGDEGELEQWSWICFGVKCERCGVWVAERGREGVVAGRATATGGAVRKKKGGACSYGRPHGSSRRFTDSQIVRFSDFQYFLATPASACTMQRPPSSMLHALTVGCRQRQRERT
jgi:hypothetical protein